MKKLSLLALTGLLPVTVCALDYSDVSNRYTDGPFSVSERAAISVLTNIGATEGNPDGTFAPNRTLNRAEFVKIVLLSHPKISVSPGDAMHCFPDIQTADWFSSYVCIAKRQGIVQGNPDGLFHPERPVNYVEAVKILAEINHDATGCPVWDNEKGCVAWETYLSTFKGAWYKPYIVWAGKEKLLLQERVAYDAPLTRGQMARLTAAFRAYWDGELEAYRQAEMGETPQSSEGAASSAPASSQGASAEVSAVASSVASSMASKSSALFPAASHLLVVGTTTPALLDGTFLYESEPVLLTSVDLVLRREVQSLSGVLLVDEKGKTVATLKLLTYDNLDKRKWRAEGADVSTYRIEKNAPIMLGIRTILKPRGNGGISRELFETESFSIQTRGIDTSLSRQIIPMSPHYPTHQTVQSAVAGVVNALPSTGTLQAGLRKKIASFTFSGQFSEGSMLTLNGVDLRLQSSGITMKNFMFGGDAEILQTSCAVDSSDSTLLTCAPIPEGTKNITSPITLSLFADVSVLVSATNPTLQAILEKPGTLSQLGAVRWSDGTGDFVWMEGPTPLAQGTKWAVTK